MPSLVGVPPAVRMTAGASYSVPPVVVTSKMPSPRRLIPSTFSWRMSAPNVTAWPAIFWASSRPRMCSKPG